jgi:hypothetical protein
MATLGTASDSVGLLRSLALAPRGSRLEAAYFVVTRERKNVSARSSSARRRAIRVGLLRSLALAPRGCIATGHEPPGFRRRVVTSDRFQPWRVAIGDNRG